MCSTGTREAVPELLLKGGLLFVSLFPDTAGPEPDSASESHAHAKCGKMAFDAVIGSHHGEAALCSGPAWVHWSQDSAYLHGWSFALCEEFVSQMGLQSSCLGAKDAYTCPVSEACKRYVAGSL